MTNSDSSFYGLLDLLSGTELNGGQSEIGKEMLYTEESFITDLHFSPNSETILRIASQGICLFG